MKALELSAAIQAKEMGVAEAVTKYIEAIEKSQSNNFLAVSKAQALAQAKKVQAQIDAGDVPSPLAGIPVAVKDNISTKGIETTCASKMLKGYVPVFNATVIDKLEQAGMIVVGKLNMDEFSMGSASNGNAAAAAVAVGEVPLAIASDTGGGIRQSCAFYGATGIKPTYGSVSRHGLIAYASSMDQIGPIGGSIDDCAAMLSVISGPDHMDSTCAIEKPFTFEKNNAQRLDGLRIGIPHNCCGSCGSDITSASSAVKELKDAGAEIEVFEMPLLEHIIPTYHIIACAEASSNLSRYDGLKYGYRSPNAETLADVYRLSRAEGFGMEVKRRIMFGSLVLSSGFYNDYYKKALQVRTLIKKAYSSLFEKYDMIISPVAPDKLEAITVSANLAGLPAVALPCGCDSQGLPMGFQLIGAAFTEEKLIKAARAYQNLTQHHLQKPGGAV